MVEKIYFDMDGVLADFDRGVKELCHIEPRDQGSFIGPDYDMWGKIRQVGHFYSKLKPMEGAVELFQLLYDKYGDKCEILTGIPRPDKGIVDAADDKINWIKKYLPYGVVVNIVYRADKKYYAKPGTILIDDLKSTILEWNEAGGLGIHHTSVPNTLSVLKENKII